MPLFLDLLLLFFPEKICLCFVCNIMAIIFFLNVRVWEPTRNNMNCYDNINFHMHNLTVFFNLNEIVYQMKPELVWLHFFCFPFIWFNFIICTRCMYLVICCKSFQFIIFGLFLLSSFNFFYFQRIFCGFHLVLHSVICNPSF